MKKLYFITRTIPEENSGGGIVRRGSVECLRKEGYDVIIVAPSSVSDISEDRILVKDFSSDFQYKYNLLLSRFGLKSDYLQEWAKKAYETLLPIVNKDDIVLATSGGEMGALILAADLKKSIGCKVVYNLHDPISYTHLQGKYSTPSTFYVHPRDKKEKELFGCADKIVTSSQFYANWLKEKYPEFEDKFLCHHFGYIQKIGNPQLSLLHHDRINVVYGGAMGKLQSPEILIQVAGRFKDIQFTYVGNVPFIVPESASNVKVLPKMPYTDFVDYLVKNADIGFFSLTGHIAKWCVPSKLYEYINSGIPMLACIEGDARNIIKENDFGEVCDYSVDGISDGLRKLLAGNRLEIVKNNILDNRLSWYMESTITELIQSFD